MAQWLFGSLTTGCVVICTSGIYGQEPLKLDLEVRVSELRAQLLQDSYAQDQMRARQLDVHALLAIIDRETIPGGDRRLAARAFAELAFYPQSEKAVKCLIENIEFLHGGLTTANHLRNYTAAQALVSMGPTAERRLISEIGTPADEKRLQLIAHTLVVMDKAEADPWNRQVTLMDRLTRILDQKVKREVELDQLESKDRAIANYRTVINYLSDPGFLSKPIPAE